MNEDTEGIAWGRVAYFVFTALSGAAAGYWGGSLIHENRDANEIIVVVFPVLAGFLIAIMTIVGDPAMFGARTWRAVELARNPTFKRLVRQKWLFLLYLITVTAVFASALLKTALPNVACILERIYFGLAVTSFLLSMSLPGALMKIQMERHELMKADKLSEACDSTAPRRG